MDHVCILPLIRSLQTLPVEGTSLLLWLLCMVSLMGFLHRFGALGGYVYNQVCILIANIQVLRGMYFAWFQHPIAMGTVVFSSLYLSNVLICEHYGKKVAQEGVWLSFFSQCFFVLVMGMTIGHTPLLVDAESPFFSMKVAEKAIETLFLPTPRLFVASLFSFSVSQFFGIWVFHRLKSISFFEKWTIRNEVVLFSMIWMDALLFNVLAWKILSSQPMSWEVLWKTYLSWALWMQGLSILLSRPVVRISYWIGVKKEK